MKSDKKSRRSGRFSVNVNNSYAGATLLFTWLSENDVLFTGLFTRIRGKIKTSASVPTKNWTLMFVPLTKTQRYKSKPSAAVYTDGLLSTWQRVLYYLLQSQAEVVHLLLHLPHLLAQVTLIGTCTVDLGLEGLYDAVCRFHYLIYACTIYWRPDATHFCLVCT